jgi:glycosyltransferase involved in cell wall biosynthesis
MLDRQLRICHVITYGSVVGGAHLNTYHSLRYQQAAHQVAALMGDDGPFRTLCEAAGVPCSVIPFKNVLVDPFNDARALWRLTAHFRRTRPDIVHTHSSKAGMLGRAAARLAGVPIVVHTVHGPSYHDGQPPPVRWAINRLERFFALFTDHLVSVTDTLRDQFIRDKICRHDRISTVVSGIDFDAFPLDKAEARIAVRRLLGVGSAARLILSVGHLQERKGYDVLVDAAARVVAAQPETLFLIVGTEVEGSRVRSKLVRQIEDLGLTRQVLLLGARDDVAALLAAGDVYVQSSRLEGLSRSLVEAMYTGLPVVATEVDATPEVVLDGETGFLVPPDDPHLMASRILLLLHELETAKRLGEAARQLVGRTRSVEAMGRGLDAIYHRLSESKGLVPAEAIQEVPGPASAE